MYVVATPVDINSGKLSACDVAMSILVAYFKFVNVQVKAWSVDSAVNPIVPLMWTSVERSIVTALVGAHSLGLPNKLPIHLVIGVVVPVSENEVTDPSSRMWPVKVSPLTPFTLPLTILHGDERVLSVHTALVQVQAVPLLMLDPINGTARAPSIAALARSVNASTNARLRDIQFDLAFDASTARPPSCVVTASDRIGSSERIAAIRAPIANARDVRRASPDGMTAHTS